MSYESCSANLRIVCRICRFRGGRFTPTASSAAGYTTGCMSRRVILNVEDDEATHFVLRKLFEEICPDVELIQATDGEQAIQVIRRFSDDPHLQLDLVLMDLNLPLRTGWEVMEAIRAVESYMKVPVIMFTGVTREEDRLRSVALGAEYIQKPSTLVDLGKVVRDVCKRLGVFAP